MVLDDWLAELPQQFKGKANIEILIKAISKQLDEVYEAFNEIDTMTNLNNSQGKNLDYMGQILAMSRKDATAVLKKASNVVLSDEFYRKVLNFAALKNACDCTYNDIMGAMSILWQTDTIVYQELPERPATILLNIPEVDIDGNDPAENRALALKSAGVAIYFAYKLWFEICISGLEQIASTEMKIKTSFTETESSNGGLLFRYDFSERTEQIEAMYVEKSVPYMTMDGAYRMNGSGKLNNYMNTEVL